MHINNQTLYVLTSNEEINVLMPRIGDSNRGLAFDFLALGDKNINNLKDILFTVAKQSYPAMEEPLNVNQISEVLNFHASKRGIPDIEFNATDPCQNVKDEEADKGTPWDNSHKVKAEPEDKAFVMPPTKGLSDLGELSLVNYNAAVSVAFEGMRLLYGPMGEKEYNQFVNLWNPLFDYPTQEIIEYLNILNPLISYFLGTRDAYMELISDFELLMLDASLAVEFDHQEAWEQIMGEAQMYANTIKGYNKILENLSREINALGNPPNPNELKCRDNETYRRFFRAEDRLSGTW